MHRTHLTQGLIALIVALGSVSCSASDEADSSQTTQSAALDAGAIALDAATVDARAPGARPPGWDEVSHGADASVDYARVFPRDGVQRLDIEIAPEQHQAMLADLEKLIGKEGTGGGMFGGGPPPEGFTACTGLMASAVCTWQGAGKCTSLGDPTKLFCLPDSFSMPGGASAGAMRPGRGGGGAIDLVMGDPVSVPVTVRYDGRHWTQVAMRYKGNSSLAGSWRAGVRKLGFRLDFDKLEDEHEEIENQRFFGFNELTFSAGFSDSSLVRDKLASEVLQDFGLKAARCAFYRVYVNVGQGPVYWGVYTMIEDPSDKLLQSQFASAEGNLYKPDGPGADFTRFDRAGFEKKTNAKAADYSDVMSAIEALHAPREDAARWRERLEAVFDVDTFLSTLALSKAIGHWDSYGVMSHNYYLYGDPQQGGRLVWISWDHNMTWLAGNGPFGGGGSIMMDEVPARWPLIRFLLDDPTYRARYRAQLERTLTGSYLEPAFAARASALHKQVAPYVLGEGGEPAEQTPYTQLKSLDDFRGALTNETGGLLTMAANKRKQVADALAAPEPEKPAP